MKWIVDSHTHLGEFPLFNVKLDIKGMIEIMDKYEIERSIVFSLPNELTLEAKKSYPGRIEGLVWINPYEGEKAIETVKEYIGKYGFKGVKLHPLIDAYLPDQPIVYPIMDLAAKYGFPVLFHSGHPPWSLPWHFHNLAQRYPDVKIILGHMGHGHIVYINGAIEVAKRNDNIYLETSGMPMHTKIKEAAEEIGVERILYGSDMPFGHPAFEIEKVKVSGLKGEDLKKILRENAMKMFSIK
ncbi:MAG: amidohydrolase [Candidatus Verstraetearchaeota archaeon]|nr:amidohydrolase [Candidatus Verstraetearchaeota archaeon]